MLKKSKMKIRRRNTEPSVNMPIANPNSSARPETDPVDPDGESEPFWVIKMKRETKTTKMKTTKNDQKTLIYDYFKIGKPSYFLSKMETEWEENKPSKTKHSIKKKTKNSSIFIYIVLLRFNSLFY